MDIPIALPLDSDGFLRRECPKCERQFKWHEGPTEDRPHDWNDPPVYWCPLCGQASEHDQFFTQGQVDFMEESAAGAAIEMAASELEKALRGVRGLSYKKSGRNDDTEPPTPLVEPDDMLQLKSPCHPWEPVKIPDSSSAPYYCLACGEAYAV
jgi:hypothetical protein